MPVDALRTATSEVPSSSLEEGRGWICLPRTGDAVPRGCLGSVLWGVLSVPCMWHCHGKLCCEQGPWCNCTAHTCVTGESSPVHTGVQNKCEHDPNQDRQPWICLIHTVQSYPKCKLHGVSQTSAAFSLFHCLQSSYYKFTNYEFSTTAKEKKRANYSHSWGNIILNAVRQLILLKIMALLWAFIIDGYLTRHKL